MLNKWSINYNPSEKPMFSWEECNNAEYGKEKWSEIFCGGCNFKENRRNKKNQKDNSNDLNIKGDSK